MTAVLKFVHRVVAIPMVKTILAAALGALAQATFSDPIVTLLVGVIARHLLAILNGPPAAPATV